jgi:hypothetical protein
VPLALLVHNTEEALAIGGTLPRMSELAARVLGPTVALPTPNQYYVALAIVTLLGFTLYGVARAWPSATYWLVVLQAVMTVNIVTHTVGAVALRGYVPGVITAWVVHAPTSWVVFRRVSDGKWMTAWQWRMLVPLAIVIHGPLLILLLHLVPDL